MYSMIAVVSAVSVKSRVRRFCSLMRLRRRPSIATSDAIELRMR